MCDGEMKSPALPCFMTHLTLHTRSGSGASAFAARGILIGRGYIHTNQAFSQTRDWQMAAIAAVRGRLGFRNIQATPIGMVSTGFPTGHDGTDGRGEGDDTCGEGSHE